MLKLTILVCNPRQTKAKIEVGQFSWTVGVKEFEIIHGLSRVVRLLPDKLVTAKCIAAEPVADDGTFLVNLVLDLLKVYLDQSERLVSSSSTAAVENPCCQEIYREIPFESRTSVDLQMSLNGTLECLRESLNSLLRSLADHNLEQFANDAKALVGLGDEILAACHAYLDFAHPLIVQSYRLNSLQDSEIDQRRIALITKLENLKNKLSNEFEQYSAEN